MSGWAPQRFMGARHEHGHQQVSGCCGAEAQNGQAECTEANEAWIDTPSSGQAAADAEKSPVNGGAPKRWSAVPRFIAFPDCGLAGELILAGHDPPQCQIEHDASAEKQDGHEPSQSQGGGVEVVVSPESLANPGDWALDGSGQLFRVMCHGSA